MEKPVDLEKMVGELKEGETIVAMWPADGMGYYIMIGDNIANHSWAITQAELDALYEQCGKYYKKGK